MSAAVSAMPAPADKPGRSSERSRSRDADSAPRRSSSSKDRESGSNGERDRSSRDGDSHKRSRDRDRDGRRGSREADRGNGDRDRDRKRSRHSHSRSRSRSRSPHRPPHRSSRPTSRSPSPPPASHHSQRHSSGGESDREERERVRAEHTVFVSAIHPRVKERELFEFFSACGRVDDVRLIKDNKTKRSKGLAYIEFNTSDGVAAALAHNGTLLAGYPVTIATTVYPPTKPGAAAAPSPDSLRLYVGSLQYAVTEADLRPIFAAIGPLDSIEVHKDSATGVSKGFGFVQYTHKADADLAMATLQGLNVAGRPLKIGLATLVGSGGASFGSFGGNANNMNSFAQLPSPTSAPAAAAQLPQQPSPCLLIANMFDPAQETEPEWDADIAEEMRDESSKYGPLLHVHVDKHSAGHVYMRFDSTGAAQAAYAAMHGRFFGGRQLHATYIPLEAYASRFPAGGA